jgi:hypothetical protein
LGFICSLFETVRVIVAEKLRSAFSEFGIAAKSGQNIGDRSVFYLKTEKCRGGAISEGFSHCALPRGSSRCARARAGDVDAFWQR